jgi:error-prone DNA polymerase
MYGEGGPAIRLGMRLVSGLGEEAGHAIEQAVARLGPFQSIQSLWRASGVGVKDLRRLAAADAFNSMGLERRAALWAIRALRDDRLPLFDQPGKSAAEMDEAPPALPILTLPAKVLRDYQVTGFSLKDHPMRPYRGTLNGAGVAPMKDLRDPVLAPHGRRIKVAGLVLLRQRPGTASGIVFMTMEDETGTANLIVPPQVYERCRRVARHSNSLIITGTVERAGEVVHIMVRRIELLVDAARGNELPVVQSRDFH